MKVVADRSLGTQPLGFGLPRWGAELDLDELGAAHGLLVILHGEAGSGVNRLMTNAQELCEETAGLRR